MLRFAAPLAVALAVHTGPIAGGYRIVDFGRLPVTLSVRVNAAAALVAVAVGVVALAVQVYSVGYLRSDDRYPPYAAQVSLFTAAMLLVVVSGTPVLIVPRDKEDRTEESRRFPAVANVGFRPTFGPSGEARDGVPLVEVHLLDFSGELYGEHLELEFHAFLRAERRFPGPEALRAAITQDVELARALLR